jgi:hypothetical protein
VFCGYEVDGEIVSESGKLQVSGVVGKSNCGIILQ